MNEQKIIEKYKRLLNTAEKEDAVLKSKLEEVDKELMEVCGTTKDKEITKKIKELEKELDIAKKELFTIMEKLEECQWE